MHLVEPYDTFLVKLFSSREKDRDDLRVLAGDRDRTSIQARYLRATGQPRSEPRLGQAARASWYVLYGDSLPS